MANAPAGPPAPPRRRTTRWLITGVFVLGAVLGVAGTLVWGGTSTSSAPPPARTTETPPPSPVPAPGTGEGGQITVDAACLRAIQAAQSAYAAISDAGDALSSLDAARLDELVRRLQPIQDQLQADSAACHVAGGTGSAVATPSPSSSPGG